MTSASSLSDQDLAFLHESIYEYLEWQLAHNWKRNARRKEEEPFLRMFQKLFLLPTSSIKPEKKYAEPSYRPLLVSALLEWQSRNPPEPAIPLVWEDYYQALDHCLKHKKLPPDSSDPRGFLSWCVHQRFVYHKYHHSSEPAAEEEELTGAEKTSIGSDGHVGGKVTGKELSIPDTTENKKEVTPGNVADMSAGPDNKDVDDEEDQSEINHEDKTSSSHLTLERISKLNLLGFQWEIPSYENTSIVVERSAPTRQERDEWTKAFEAFKPYLAPHAVFLDEATDSDDAKQTLPQDTAKNETPATADTNSASKKSKGKETLDILVKQAEQDAAKNWLRSQIHRYREWDAGFVDFPKDQRDTLNKVGLLPNLVATMEPDWLLQSVHSESEEDDDQETEDEDTDDEDNRRVTSKRPRHDLLIQDDDEDTHPNKKSKSTRKLPTRLQDAKENGVRQRKPVGSSVRKDVVNAVMGRNPSADRSKPSSQQAAYDERWNARYEQLVEFHRMYGHCRVPRTEDARLYNWVKKQRAKYRDKDDYPLERKVKLDRLGFCWDPTKETSSVEQTVERWNARYEQLVEFHRMYGHCRVPRTEDARLYNWVKKQRAKYREKDDYPLERKVKLDRLGFCWDPTKETSSVEQTVASGPHSDVQQQAWFERFEQLKAFKKRFGHTNVPPKWEENPALGNWVRHQREYCRNALKGIGSFPRIRLNALKQIGFTPLVNSDVAATAASPAASGSTKKRSVPTDYYETDQKTHRRSSRGKEVEVAPVQNESDATSSSEDSISAVALGNEIDEEMKAPTLDADDGSTEVEEGSPKRRARVQGNAAEGVPRSNSKKTSSASSNYEMAWFEKFNQLKAFKKRFGHMNVPRTWTENPALWNWVRHQRAHYRKALKGVGSFPAYRRKALEEIGFGQAVNREAAAPAPGAGIISRKGNIEEIDQTLPTSPTKAAQLLSERLWLERLEQLKIFKKRFGHMDVPRTWEENPALGNWVRHQRAHYRQASSSFPESRRKALQEIGFDQAVNRKARRTPSTATENGQAHQNPTSPSEKIHSGKKRDHNLSRVTDFEVVALQDDPDAASNSDSSIVVAVAVDDEEVEQTEARTVDAAAGSKGAQEAFSQERAPENEATDNEEGEETRASAVDAAGSTGAQDASLKERTPEHESTKNDEDDRTRASPVDAPAGSTGTS